MDQIGCEFWGLGLLIARCWRFGALCEIVSGVAKRSCLYWGPHNAGVNGCL